MHELPGRERQEGAASAYHGEPLQPNLINVTRPTFTGRERRTLFKAPFKRLAPYFQLFSGVHELRKGTAISQAAEYDRLKEKLRSTQPENVALSGYKVYSQTDEDGIIAEIFSRLGGGGTFVEIGVQTGVECNTLLLLLGGWRGVWIEGSAAHYQTIVSDLGAATFDKRFRVQQAFVTRENIVSLAADAISFLGTEQLDLLSVDIDGNDLHVLRALMASHIRPGVICVEYQAKFPPPISVTVDYKPDHVWDGTDYMGSSLQAFVDLFAGEYRLVTCNLPGINAFFVRVDRAAEFPEIPVDRLYQPYRPHLSPFVPGQVPSLGYLKTLLAGTEA
jgi:hypothetical protein